MEIRGTGSTGNVGKPDPVRSSHLHAGQIKPTEGNKIDHADRVEISDLARLKALLKEVPEVRLDKIDEIRSQIDAGTYESPDKIDRIVEKLLDELGEG